jgi:hypothetical protein
VDVDLHEDARAELLAAATKYAVRDARTGARFVAEYERVERLIAAPPVPTIVRHPGRSNLT